MARGCGGLGANDNPVKARSDGGLDPAAKLLPATAGALACDPTCRATIRADRDTQHVERDTCTSATGRSGVARALVKDQNRRMGRLVERTRLTVGASRPPKANVALRNMSIPSSELAGKDCGEIGSPTETTYGCLSLFMVS